MSTPNVHMSDNVRLDYCINAAANAYEIFEPMSRMPIATIPSLYATRRMLACWDIARSLSFDYLQQVAHKQVGWLKIELRGGALPKVLTVLGADQETAGRLVASYNLLRGFSVERINAAEVDLVQLAKERDAAQAMLLRIAEAEFGYGDWPSEEEIRAAAKGGAS